MTEGTIPVCCLHTSVAPIMLPVNDLFSDASQGQGQEAAEKSPSPALPCSAQLLPGPACFLSLCSCPAPSSGPPAIPAALLLTVFILNLVFGQPLFFLDPFPITGPVPHPSLWPLALLHFISVLSLSSVPPPMVLTPGPLTSISVPTYTALYSCLLSWPPADPGQGP